MNETVYEKLKEIARARSVIPYQQVGNLIGLDMTNEEHRYRIGQLLDEINRTLASEDKPMISAVVVRRESSIPGSGFFQCARNLGKLTGPDDEDTRLRFFRDELQAVYDYWGTH